MHASDYLETAILNYFFRNQQVTQPTEIYLGLFLTAPTDANTGTEVSGGGYSRKRITFTAPTSQGEDTVITNATDILYPKATSSWGEFAYFGVLTAASGGQLLAHGTLNKAETINEGNELKIAQGALTIKAG